MLLKQMTFQVGHVEKYHWDSFPKDEILHHYLHLGDQINFSQVNITCMFKTKQSTLQVNYTYMFKYKENINIPMFMHIMLMHAFHPSTFS